MKILRSVGLVILILGIALLSVQASAGQEVILIGGPNGIPLPQGKELSDEELLEVEGEIAFIFALLGLAALGAAAGAGGAAIHENWFDEDYGIDRDDWRDIGSGAVTGAIGGLAGGCGARLFAL
jgi:hypothetical protein